jgi:hypothetical protein
MRRMGKGMQKLGYKLIYLESASAYGKRKLKYKTLI